MKKGLTELVFILDRSGSMAGMEEDTIGGFNGLIEKQKQQPGEALVTTVLFGSHIQQLHNRVDLHNVQPLTTNDYYVCGMTALLDAVGSTILQIDRVHQLIGEDSCPEHTMFIITTDGMENCSKEFTVSAVKGLIEQHQQKYGWEFLFLAANIDAAASAGKIGIQPNRAVNYHADSIGTQLNYAVMSEAISGVRSGKKVGSSWKKRIEQDFLNRKNK